MREKRPDALVKVFLTGVNETARQASTPFRNIKIEENIENTLRNTAGRRTHTALVLLMRLFEEPFIHVKQAEEICNLSTKAANDMVGLFVQQGILKEVSGKTRYRLFLFEPYLDLFK